MLHMNDPASYLKIGASLSHSLVAGAASDNAAQTTEVIDRRGCLGAMVYVPWDASAVTNTKKLIITVTREQSSDGTNFDAAETVQAATDVFTATAEDTAEEGIIEIEQDLTGCKRYVKYNITANLTADNTDTACYSCVVVLFGADALPVA